MRKPNFVEMIDTGAAEQPILTQPVQAALHQWLIEINAEQALAKIGVKPRSSSLLSGPPGCGKTTLALHLGQRLGIELASVMSDGMRSKYVGAAGNNVSDLFTWAKEYGPDKIILFFDEFDALAGTRSGDTDSAAARDDNAVVNALLQRIESYPGLLIAATNLSDNIDPAIWRRFGLQIEIGLPGQQERFAILARYLRPFRPATELLNALADVTHNASPAILRQFAENLKRDTVLAPKLNLPATLSAAIDRAATAIQPHASMTLPLLWSNRAAALTKITNVAGELQWPPAPQ